MVETRSRSKSKTVAKENEFSRQTLSKDECADLNVMWAKCRANRKSSSVKIKSSSPAYNAFVATLLKHCVPYTGRKVFVVRSNGALEFICPDYKLRVGHFNLSVSITANGYIYVHYLHDYVPNSGNCVFSGDHITIAPTGKTHIHFHITSIMYQMDHHQMLYASSYNSSFCSLPLEDVVRIFRDKTLQTADKKKWLADQACVNEYNVSFHKSTVEMLNDDMTFDIIFRIFLRGFPKLQN